MRLLNIPTDVAISASFVAVFLLAFVPASWVFAPDLLLAIRAARAELRGEPPSVG
jgi:hypothetical protein